MADPVRQYPGIFGNSELFTKYPYALPNLLASAMLFISCVFGFLFIKETLDAKKDQVDPGIRTRRFIYRISEPCFSICRRRKFSKAQQRINPLASETNDVSSDEDGILPHRRDSDESMPLSPSKLGEPISRPTAYHRYRRRSSNLSAFMRRPVYDINRPPPPRFRDIFTEQVVLNMIVYSGLALHSISFDQLFPLLCSTRVEDGGLAMTPGQIGMALSVSGVLAMVLQITLFPWGHGNWGSLACLRVSLALYPLNYFVYPHYTPPNSVYSLSTEIVES